MLDLSRRTALAGATALAASTLLSTLSLAQGAAPMITTQAPGFHRYKVGDIVMTAIHDGFTPRNLEGLIKNADAKDVREVVEKQFLSFEAFPVNYTTTVAQTSEDLILIDTGLADFGPATAGKWMANFKAAGFDPKDVKKVIISHFHGDHINGIRYKDGSTPFVNAEIMVPAAEWAFWMNDENMNKAPEAARGGFMNVRRVFAPLAKDIKQYGENVEVAKGITAIPAYGHSPGHNIFAVTSGNAKMMLLSDLGNHPALFVKRPEWSAIFDMDADKARATRFKVLDMVASERMMIAFYHAPFPATGYVARDGKNYDFVPNMIGM
jgi:glyoxylase-like metal-dependent hydrolase (beta-lactamase superfamily II)